MSSYSVDLYQTKQQTTTSASAVDNGWRTGNLNPDQGRISKPGRRRPRASQRSPVTLLNADPTNFRALVQRYTGGPSPQMPINNSFDFNQRIAGDAGEPGVFPAGYHPIPNEMAVNNDNNMLGDGIPFYAAPVRENENRYYYTPGGGL